MKIAMFNVPFVCYVLCINCDGLCVNTLPFPYIINSSNGNTKEMLYLDHCKTYEM